MNTIFDGPDEIDEEHQEILSAIEPDMSEQEDQECEPEGGFESSVPKAYQIPVLPRLNDCVHGPDPDVSVPAGSGSPSNLSGKSVGCTEADEPAGSSAPDAQTLSDGKLRAPVNGNINWPDYKPMPLDKTESFTAWLDAQGDHLALPDSFKEWLDKNGDAI